MVVWNYLEVVRPVGDNSLKRKWLLFVLDSHCLVLPSHYIIAHYARILFFISPIGKPVNFDFKKTKTVNSIEYIYY